MKTASAINSKNIVALLFVPILLGAEGAAARSAILSPPVQHPPAYCHTSALGNHEFMQMVRSIIAHGNLQDVAFIEKTLGTKFIVSYSSKGDGSPDPSRPIYSSDNLLGSSIHITLYAHYSKANPPKAGWRSTMNFEGFHFPSADTNFMTDCLRISTSEFFSTFKGSYFFGIPVGMVPPPPITKPIFVTAISNQLMPGKNGSTLRIRFSYMHDQQQSFATENSLVSRVEIDQEP